ncbi:hypothetical protein BAE44_0011786 [Dichanthelium oligosanthes]|uniref:Protein IQ-DOMAIN 31 n=1 Tax=Dichanthelium oligosanthes TaxID=888268 RepID=A0A1E5VQ60_9POAL|nr:hypothetical protein BAE44_0011786 [Dichanthelium oligosanthes]
MARGRGLCCLASPLRGKTSDADTRGRRSSAACICCIGPHHKPSGGASNADLSVRLPLTSCCGSGGDVRGRSAARTLRTPTTPCTPTARRVCGVRSRTPRRGQVCCFPAPHAAAASAAASAGGQTAAAARTPRTPTTPLGGPQRGACCVRVPAQGNAKLGRRRSWFRSARQAVAQTTPRFRGVGGSDSTRARNNNDAVKVYDARLAEVEAAAAAAATVAEETCSNDEYALLCQEGFSREDVAAVTIQAYFRGHLARRASKALKSLVRLQAVARGAYVRRQAEVAIHCMQAMVRLQMRVRARQMLVKPKEEQLLQS